MFDLYENDIQLAQYHDQYFGTYDGVELFEHEDNSAEQGTAQTQTYHSVSEQEKPPALVECKEEQSKSGPAPCKRKRSTWQPSEKRLMKDSLLSSDGVCMISLKLALPDRNDRALANHISKQRV